MESSATGGTSGGGQVTNSACVCINFRLLTRSHLLVERLQVLYLDLAVLVFCKTLTLHEPLEDLL